MKNTGFQTTITSEHKLMDLHIKETFRYRDLIFLFVKRDFTAMYKQTVLGPLWAIIQPLLTTLVFTVIFGKLEGRDWKGRVMEKVTASHCLDASLEGRAGRLPW